MWVYSDISPVLFVCCSYLTLLLVVRHTYLTLLLFGVQNTKRKGIINIDNFEIVNIEAQFAMICYCCFPVGSVAAIWRNPQIKRDRSPI
jgi:hypothetical protein